MRNASGVLHRKFQNAVGPIHAYVDTLASLLVWRVWGSSWRPSPFQAACLQNPNPADEAKKYCKPLKVRFPVPRSCLRFLLARGPQNNRWFVLRLPVRTAPRCQTLHTVPFVPCVRRYVRTYIRTYLRADLFWTCLPRLPRRAVPPLSSATSCRGLPPPCDGRLSPRVVRESRNSRPRLGAEPSRPAARDEKANWPEVARPGTEPP